MRTYLIVDDNRALADNLADILRDRGAEVTLAADGAEALEYVQRQRFDALITDMRMPTLGGAELLRRARAVDPQLPTLVITAYTNDAELEAAMALAPLAVLPKPVPLEKLISVLEGARRGQL